jgi:hypothetical protein
VIEVVLGDPDELRVRTVRQSAHNVARESAGDLLRRWGIVSGREIGLLLRRFLDAGIVKLAEGSG